MIKDLRILVISHNFLLKNFIQDTCRDLFTYKIIFEDTPLIETAVEVIKKQDFDFVILELNLPESRGVMTIEKYKILIPEIKVIVMSWSLDKIYIQECIEAGADAYIGKSILSSNLLVNTCKKLLQATQLEEQFSNPYKMQLPSDYRYQKFLF